MKMAYYVEVLKILTGDHVKRLKNTDYYVNG